MLIAQAFELTLVFAGLVLLWPLAFSHEARDRRAARLSPLTTWDAPLSEFLLFLWIVICGGLVGQFASTFFYKGRSEDGKLILANGALEFGMLAGIALYRFGFSREKPRFDFAPLHALWTGAVTFIVAMPIVVGSGLIWQFFLEKAGLPIEPQDMIGRLANAGSPKLLIAMVTLATVTAPITEELIFRAGFFRYCRTRLPRWAALFAPACLFAALHQNLATFAPLVALGIVFSLAYERTGRIGTSIVAHGLFNAHTVALIFVAPSLAN
jgi:membrane protease YdiL (CAAX protease family)